jgi:syntaxin-binding protein 1
LYVASVYISINRNKKTKAELSVEDDSEYASSRYVPKVKTLLAAMAENTLDVDEYPSVLPMPEGSSGSAASVRTKTTRSRGRWGNDKKTAGFSGPRLLVFIAGGASFSELRSAEEVMASGEREVMIGSTAFLKPDEYLQNVLTL